MSLMRSEELEHIEAAYSVLEKFMGARERKVLN